MGFFNTSSSSLILTVVLLILGYLFAPGLFDDPILAVVSIVVAFIVSSVAMQLYTTSQTVQPKVIAFDAGGVYFKGNYFTDEIQPREGFAELVADLKAKGSNVVMLTNQNKMVSDFIAEKFSLTDIFDQIFSSGEIKIAKPDPRIFNAVMEQLGIDAKNFIFVDDYQPNVEGAQNAGVTGIKFESIEQLREELQKLKLL
jgi:HAD superfamily hydrolase (TIGR01509 family)